MNKEQSTRKKIIIFLIIFIFVIPFLAFGQAGSNIATGIPFGGFVQFFIPCTCPPPGLWIFMAPLYPAPVPFPFAGALTFNLGISTLFANFFIGIPTTAHLGDYVPAVQSCWIGFPPFCVPLPSFGQIARVGTSAPGALP